jgi:DNA mismatch repair ATPase MutS
VNAFLLFRDRDSEEPALPIEHHKELIQDLGLGHLLEAMAGGDGFVREVANRVLLSSASELDTIRYRQAILSDCLNHSSLVKEIYDLAVDAIVREKKDFWTFSKGYPRWILSRSIGVLRMFVNMLRKLRRIADGSADKFESEGFKRFFAMLSADLSDEYFEVLEGHLNQLEFRDGVLLSAKLGLGNKGAAYILRRNPEAVRKWIDWLFLRTPESYTFRLHPRDENGHNALADLRDEGINVVANAVAQSADHILGFFRMLRSELAFYIGCLNLQQRLAEQGLAICFPTPLRSYERRHSCRGLYDVCLALSLGSQIVSNDLSADGKDLIVITGANQGGKSTFLRGIGLAQIMMQCGMFVAAKSFSANVCEGVFSHYKREEDPTMKSGKFDEELKRMSAIVDRLTTNSIVFLNESFAATNEREGSEIAKQIVSALLERRIKVFFVTHLYEFARAFHSEGSHQTLFLRAARDPDGTRTFKLVESEPLPTSFGQDLYEKIFAIDG